MHHPIAPLSGKFTSWRTVTTRQDFLSKSKKDNEFTASILVILHIFCELSFLSELLAPGAPPVKPIVTLG